jgi:hypothetical protein
MLTLNHHCVFAIFTTSGTTEDAAPAPAPAPAAVHAVSTTVGGNVDVNAVDADVALETLKKDELRAMLFDRGLSTAGNKGPLFNRLATALAKERVAPAALTTPTVAPSSNAVKASSNAVTVTEETDSDDEDSDGAVAAEKESAKKENAKKRDSDEVASAAAPPTKKGKKAVTNAEAGAQSILAYSVSYSVGMASAAWVWSVPARVRRVC